MQVSKRTSSILQFVNNSGPTTNSAIVIEGIVGNSTEISIGPIFNGTPNTVSFCVAMFYGNCAPNPQSSNKQILYLNPDPANVQSPGPTNLTLARSIPPQTEDPGWTVATQTPLIEPFSLFAEGLVQGSSGTVGFSPINAFHDYPVSLPAPSPGPGRVPIPPPICPPEGFCFSFPVGHDSPDFNGTTLSVAQVMDPTAKDVDPALLDAVKHLPQAKDASAFLSFGPERITPPPPSLRWREVGSLQRTGELSIETHSILRGSSEEKEAIDRDMLPGETHQALLRAKVEVGAVAVFKVSHRSRPDGAVLGELSLVLVGGSQPTRIVSGASGGGSTRGVPRRAPVGFPRETAR